MVPAVKSLSLATGNQMSILPLISAIDLHAHFIFIFRTVSDGVAFFTAVETEIKINVKKFPSFDAILRLLPLVQR